MFSDTATIRLSLLRTERRGFVKRLPSTQDQNHRQRVLYASLFLPFSEVTKTQLALINVHIIRLGTNYLHFEQACSNESTKLETNFRLPNKMKILLISFVLILQTWLIQGQNKFATCNRAWTKIGCFKDDVKQPSRPLPEMLLNDRDRYSKYHESGYRLNWLRWKESTHSLACRCAERALEKGYNVFGLQFYGECWSGPFAEFNYSRDGQSDNCIMNLEKPTDCNQNQAQECVGLTRTNYIYKLTANPGPQSPDVDGGYTQWSNWSECSKSCGGGSKSRERTCTNPRPEGNGKPCYPHLGEAEEDARCNQHRCDNCDKQMDVAIVVDSSSSVRRNNFEKVKDFLVKLVDQMDVSYGMTHVVILPYNHRPLPNWDFRSYLARNKVKQKEAIKKLKYKPGGTRTDRAMKYVNENLFNLNHGERPDTPKVLIVITDGNTNAGSTPYSEVLQDFEDVNIVAVGVGSSVDNNELKQIAKGIQDNVVHVQNVNDLVSRIHDILKKSCQQRKKRPIYPSNMFEIA